MTRDAAVTTLVLGVTLACALAACGPPRPAPKGRVRAVWIDHDAAPPTRATVAALRGAGIEEAFVEVATLETRGGEPVLVERSAPPAPVSMPATLVVEGSWSAPAKTPAAIAAAWAEQLETLSRRAEERGWLPIGIHFDLAFVPPSAETARALADVVSRLRDRLGRRLYLSATLPRDLAGSDRMLRLERAVDFGVAFLWGQSPSASEDPPSWDLQRTVADRQTIERAGAPFVVGGWTLARDRHLDAAGRELGPGSGVSLARIARSPELEPRAGSVLEGIDHQVWEFDAVRPTRLGSWDLAKGDRVRVVAPARANLEDFLERVGDAPTAHQLGFVLRGWPGAADRLSLTPAALASTLAPGRPEPQLAVTLDGFARTSGGVGFRVHLRNRGDEATDLATAGSNYVELRIPGAVVTHVEPGDFTRWEQLWHGSERRTLRALRDADTVRLFVPLVDAGGVVSSGVVTVRWRGQGAPEVLAGGSFLFPGGRVWNPQPQPWSFGSGN